MNGRVATTINAHAKLAGYTNAERRSLKRTLQRLTGKQKASQLRLIRYATDLLPPDNEETLSAQKRQVETDLSVRRMTTGDTRIIWLASRNETSAVKTGALPALMLLENGGTVWQFMTDESVPHTPIPSTTKIFDRYWYIASTEALPEAHQGSVAKALSMRPMDFAIRSGRAATI